MYAKVKDAVPPFENLSETVSWIQTLPVINDSALAEVVSLDMPGEGRGSFLKELVGDFKGIAPDMINNILSGSEKKDFQVLHRLSHKLKGMSVAIAAQKISEICGTIEYLAAP